MSPVPTMLYCRCAYAQVVPQGVKDAVLQKLCDSGASFESVSDLCEMAAHRDGFPVCWTARQRLDPVHHRIHFTHVRGISRGMEVTWFLEADGPLVHVRIVHDLTWRWPPIGPFIAHYIIGEIFVSNIASKTLRIIKQHVEGQEVSRSC